ncbi:hypothetical protein COO60DRAFT_1114661 [Scenedesmus sp. NREL 46B-D3]|nr:hypothetical protein COO60DRAFT_1114661 [Scenedesmus sp. NREL 46B-D3]
MPWPSSSSRLPMLLPGGSADSTSSNPCSHTTAAAHAAGVEATPQCSWSCKVVTRVQTQLVSSESMKVVHSRQKPGLCSIARPMVSTAHAYRLLWVVQMTHQHAPAPLHGVSLAVHGKPALPVLPVRPLTPARPGEPVSNPSAPSTAGGPSRAHSLPAPLAAQSAAASALACTS